MTKIKGIRNRFVRSADAGLLMMLPVVPATTETAERLRPRVRPRDGGRGHLQLGDWVFERPDTRRAPPPDQRWGLAAKPSTPRSKSTADG